MRLLRLPYRLLFPAIVVFCAIGLYSLKLDVFDVYAAALACIFGYLLSRLNLPAAPLLPGFVLGPAIEENFRRAMLLSRGDAMVFFTSPLSAGLLACAAVGLAMAVWPGIRRVRRAALKE